MNKFGIYEAQIKPYRKHVHRYSPFFFGTYGIWSKGMALSFGEFSQAWTRALILLLILIPFGIWKKQFKKIEKKDIVWFVLLSFSGGLNQAPYFFGFEHLSIGTATLLFYTSLTLGAYIIGKLFFAETLTFIKYAALALAVVGMSCIYSFSLSSTQLFPALCTIIAGFMGASIVLFSKKVSDRHSETQILTLAFVVMLIGNLLISLVTHNSIPSFQNPAWLSQFGYCAAMLIANTFAISGFRHISEPSIGGLVGLFEVIFGILFGIILFHEHVTFLFVVGSLIILAAIALPDVVEFMKKRVGAPAEN